MYLEEYLALIRLKCADELSFARYSKAQDGPISGQTIQNSSAAKYEMSLT